MSKVKSRVGLFPGEAKAFIREVEGPGTGVVERSQLGIASPIAGREEGIHTVPGLDLRKLLPHSLGSDGG